MWSTQVCIYVKYNVAHLDVDTKYHTKTTYYNQR